MNAPTLAIVDDGSPRCLYQTRPSRPAREPRTVGPIEAGWINFQPYFEAPVAEHSLPTSGTMKPLDPLARFASRVAEWQSIEATQKAGLELETVGQELARTGLTTISLSSSSTDDSDDDLVFEADDQLAERHACRYGTAYDYPDPALVRRIEWERFALGCGPITKVWLAPAGEGLTITSDQPSAKLGPAALASFAPALKRALDGRSPIELIADRVRARFYGGIGSLLYGVRTGEHEPIQSIIDAMMAEDDEDESTDGPKELAFDDEGHPNEPGEAYLWPVTEDEVRRSILRGLSLSEVELRWLETHPDEARGLIGLVPDIR